MRSTRASTEQGTDSILLSDANSTSTAGPLTTFSTPREKAILVGVEFPTSAWSLASSMAELERLATTAGADTLARITQRLSAPYPATFVGSGKAHEIADVARELGADIVIFDDELTPSQQTNLERIVDRSVKVIDRTALILDIFGMRAMSREGRLQVRLAQNQYLYPRLRGMWAHLASNRMGGGVGSRFGEGESQLEVDRRMVRKRITSIKRELVKLNSVRALQRSQRYRSDIFKVALAGYTNAGKSSLLNKLCQSDVLSDDLLFATLDATTRRFTLPSGDAITITDTVGFIQKLPTTLIEAFKSTLDEINGSDLVIHLVDATSEEFDNHINAVLEILEEIGAQKIPRLLVFNKIDAIDPERLEALRWCYKDALFISTWEGEGIDDLTGVIAQIIASQDELMDMFIPYEQGKDLARIHALCAVISEDYRDDGVALSIKGAPATLEKFTSYQVR